MKSSVVAIVALLAMFFLSNANAHDSAQMNELIDRIAKLEQETNDVFQGYLNATFAALLGFIVTILLRARGAKKAAKSKEFDRVKGPEIADLVDQSIKKLEDDISYGYRIIKRISNSHALKPIKDWELDEYHIDIEGWFLDLRDYKVLIIKPDFVNGNEHTKEIETLYALLEDVVRELNHNWGEYCELISLFHNLGKSDKERLTQYGANERTGDVRENSEFHQDLQNAISSISDSSSSVLRIVDDMKKAEQDFRKILA